MFNNFKKAVFEAIVILKSCWKRKKVGETQNKTLKSVFKELGAK